MGKQVGRREEERRARAERRGRVEARRAVDVISGDTGDEPEVRGSACFEKRAGGAPVPGSVQDVRPAVEVKLIVLSTRQQALELGAEVGATAPVHGASEAQQRPVGLPVTDLPAHKHQRAGAAF